jgi:pimeloyl-ACP methyl ester carboxylesterase
VLGRVLRAFRGPVPRELRLEGRSARYLCAGSGPPLLVLPSPLLTARTYLPLLGALQRSFTVVILELAGSGGSARLERSWSIEEQAHWVLEAVRRLPLAAPLLVGHSASGAVALELARRAPRDVRGVVLASPCGVGRPRRRAERVVSRLLDAILEPAFTLTAAPHLLTNALRHRGRAMEHARSVEDIHLEAIAREVHVPVLLAWGDRDRVSPLESGVALSQILPDARLVVGRGHHDWLLTSPRAAAAAIVRFARTCEPRRMLEQGAASVSLLGSA